MKDIIKNLYYGKIIPWERKEPQSQELLKIIRKIETEEGYFTQKLSPEDRERFQALADLYTELRILGDESIFSYGFTLGMTMMLDVMRQGEAM